MAFDATYQGAVPMAELVFEGSIKENLQSKLDVVSGSCPLVDIKFRDTNKRPHGRRSVMKPVTFADRLIDNNYIRGVVMKNVPYLASSFDDDC
jgi:hypothetical protein